MSKIWIKNCIIVSMVNSITDSGPLYYVGDITIEDNLLKTVGTKVDDDFKADTIIDGTNFVALPGFVNAHTHAAMTIFRSYADDLPLMTWLQDKIWPAEDKLTAEDVYWGSKLCILEMLLSGTTTFADMYSFMPEVAMAIEETGIRACLSRGLIDAGSNGELGLLEGEELIKNWHGKSNGRITTMLGPHAPYTCSPAYLEKVMALAEKYQVGIHIHVAETSGEFNDIKQQYGKTPVGHLNSLGLFDYPTLAAHCVHLTDEDINILHEKGVAVAHNPESNMKLASGVAPVVKLLNKGVTVALGTDGASSNNNLDMLEEMRSAALLHKATGDPTVIYSYQALEMATKNGAKALGLEDKIGMLKPGMMADLILFDFDKPHLYPKHDILAHLVYSAQSSDVDTVIVNGKIVVQGGKPLTIDSKETCQQVQKVAERITGSDMLNGR
jgi:5-methylthioadenosine/S-adenosylhomocysteine deaminase